MKSRLTRSGWLAAAVSVWLVGCGSDPQPEQPPLSPGGKGYFELYSWKSNAVGEDWCFSLITGTNRSKDRSEIGPPDDTEGAGGPVKLSLCDLALFEKTLARLPRDQSLFWVDGRFVTNDAPRLPPLTVPERAIVDRIRARCAALGITLVVSD